MEKKKENSMEPLKDSELEQVDGGTSLENKLSGRNINLLLKGEAGGSVISTPATGKNKPVVPINGILIDTNVTSTQTDTKTRII